MALELDWEGDGGVRSHSYRCWHCGNLVASHRGWNALNPTRNMYVAGIRICPHCKYTTLFVEGKAVPAAPFGDPVEHLPAEVRTLYDEARAIAQSAPTAAVMICRKILMNVAVEKGADRDRSFAYYVDHLATAGYVPPGGKEWVERIREKGNEANHEIMLMGPEDAEELLSFLGMLLKFIYEFPTQAKAAAAKATTRAAPKRSG